MNTARARSLALLSLLLASPIIGATPAQEAELAISELQKKIPAADPASTAPAGAQQTLYLQNALASLRGSLARGDIFEAERMLANTRSTVAGDPKLTALLEEATAILKKSADALEASTAAALESTTAKVRQKVAARAPAKDFDTLLAELNRLPLSRNQRYYQENGPTQQVESLRNFISRWQDYLNHTALGNADQASNSLQQLSEIASRTNIIPRSELLALQQAVTETRETGTAALAARVTDLARRLQAAINAQTKPADLDTFLEEIGTLRQQLEKQRSNSTQDQYRRLDLLRRLATGWQDYLIQLAAGNRSAQDTLRNLTNDPQLETLYPRSKLLALLNNKPSPDSPVVQPAATPPKPESLTLDNLDTFAAQLSLIPRNTLDSTYVSFPNSLSTLQQYASQIKAGNSQSALMFLRIRTTESVPPQYREALGKVRADLTSAAVIVLLEPPKDLLMGKDETLFPYVTRVLRTANERRDWALAQRSAEALGNLGANFEIASYRLFFAAQNFERAGQFPNAVQCYLGSLRTGSQNLPIDEIAARLKALREQHPKEFEQGEKMPFPSAPPIESRIIDSSTRSYPVPLPPVMPR